MKDIPPIALLRGVAALVFTLLLQQQAMSVEVVDALHRVVKLEQPAQRIISLAPHATEMLYAAGAGDRVVGVVQYSDYPEAARALPSIGSYAHFDIEAILALHPDLIVAWSSGNPAAALEQLQGLGIPIYYTEPRHLDDIVQDLRRLGDLAGTAAIADATAQHMSRRVAALKAQPKPVPPLRVFYQVWDNPLLTINGEHLISEVIELCGGVNVFASLPTLVPRVDVEAVLEARPDVIIASGMAVERPEWLDNWRNWPQLPAVQNHALYHIHPDLIQRQGPRIVAGADEMCKYLEQARSKKGSR